MAQHTDLAVTETNKTLTAISEVARRAEGRRPDIPHPFETDANLAKQLAAATEAALTTGTGWRNRIERRLLDTLFPSQRAFNQAMIDTIHQLDHRGRQQREEIADLHQRLTAAETSRPSS